MTAYLDFIFFLMMDKRSVRSDRGRTNARRLCPKLSARQLKPMVLSESLPAKAVLHSQ